MRVNVLTLTGRLLAMLSSVKLCFSSPEKMQEMYKELLAQMPSTRAVSGSDKGILEFQVPTLDGYFAIFETNAISLESCFCI